MSTIEKLLREAGALTPSERRALSDALAEKKQSAEQQERDRIAANIRGKYVNVLTGSEVFASRKAEEIAMENRP
jgi:hypothetical protein